jgi:putative ABC transport system permease protein
MRLSRRLYRVGLWVWPAWLRKTHGGDAEAGFVRLVSESRRAGRIAGAVAVVRGLADVVYSGIRFRLRPALERSLANVPAASGGPATNGRSKRSMTTLISDVRYAVRTLVRQPVFTFTAIVTLGLGIGANAAVFSIVYGLLFRPFPYGDADRLVLVWSGNPSRGWTRTDVSPADVVDWRSRTSVFEDLGVIGRTSVNLSGVEQPERLEAHALSSNVLQILRVSPVLGRDFEAADARPGAAGTVLLSWGLWQRRFGGDPSVLGRSIILDDEARTVIGVLPRDFVAFQGAPEIWLPLRSELSEISRNSHSYIAIGRLLPGIPVERASRDVAAVAEALASEYPDTNEGWTARVISLREDVVGPVGLQSSAVLTGAVVFVLLMACVNVANLLLARANGRRREMAVRTALGAGRLRMIRQLLTESLLLSIGGAAIGMLLALFGVRAIAAALSSDFVPGVFAFEVDLAVLLYALGAALVATLLFGLMPAIRTSSASAGELREEGRSGEGRRSRRFGSSLIVTQTALAVVLLVGGGMMMRSVAGLYRQDLGYDASGVLTFRLSPPDSRYPDAESLDRLYGDMMERMRALPGVRAAGTIHSLPLRGSNTVGTFAIAGQPLPDEDGSPARMGYISDEYIEAMAIDVTRGRAFTRADGPDAPPVALINESLARQHFGDEEAIGRILSMGDQDAEIVGVVADMRERSIMRDPEPSIYLPVAQVPVRSRNFAVRVAGDPTEMVQAVRAELLQVDPALPAYEIRPMQSLFDTRVAPLRLVAGLMLGFALVSLLLGAVGIYGVTSYGVGRRTTEIGIRMAVGAERAAVIRMIVREGIVRAGLGIAIGLGLAFPLSRALQGLLVGVNPGDPVTFGAVAVLLALVAFLGAWLPARRVARLDPLRALSHD